MTLNLEGLTKIYKDKVALDRISFSLNVRIITGWKMIPSIRNTMNTSLNS